jgi:hypothetical protein
MKGIWLTGVSGVLTVVVAVVLMAYSAPTAHAQRQSTAATQSMAAP